MTFKPFILNSNIVMSEKDVSSSPNYFNCIGDNIGNSYITYSLVKTLYGSFQEFDHIPSIYSYDFSDEDKDTDYINNNCSHLFFILQDQIRIEEAYKNLLPYEKIINFLKKIKIPVIIAGLGANSLTGYENDFHKSLSKELIKFVRFLSEKCGTLGLRGYFTQEVLSKIGVNNTCVIGCPSYFELGKGRVICKKFLLDNSKVLLSSLVNPEFDAVYPIFLQDEKQIINAKVFNVFSCGMPHEYLKILREGRFFTFASIQNWKNFVSQFDFVAGLRVHGAILALNCGVCSVVMNGDSRAREMCELFHIPYYPELRFETDIRKIYNKCDYIETNKFYPELYNNYIDFLHKKGIKTTDITSRVPSFGQPELPRN